MDDLLIFNLLEINLNIKLSLSREVDLGVYLLSREFH